MRCPIKYHPGAKYYSDNYFQGPAPFNTTVYDNFLPYVAHFLAWTNENHTLL